VIFLHFSVLSFYLSYLATYIIEAAKVEELKPKINPLAKRIKITYGPFKIKGLEVNLYDP